ncbi:MAG TPA: DNA alkylation repair protein [Bacteroidales bacterium]|nr:DNA alkylation repair protein [Bacteroidales bacterium]HPT21226.1 DNA alkylation repair protein [Bacteroidales bacterium]
MDKILDEIRHELLQNADEKTKLSGERFFKEEVKMYGVKSAVGEKIAKNRFKSLEDKSKAQIFLLCEELWKSGYMEESFIACNWSYSVSKQYEPDDFKIFERWVNNYVTNWASCDTLCNHSVGTFIEMYPEYISGLKKWAKSENRWVKRASSVTLIIPARHGKFLNDIFEIADILHSDPDDMVQKGYGWMLKAASQAHQKEVFDYVMSRKKTMPRTSLRYAIEKMPPELRSKAMEKAH